MSSEADRREVAETLRKCGAELSILGAGCETAFHVIDNAIGCRDEDLWERFFARLADLIDRPTCFDTESKDSKSFTCSACGFSESKLIVTPFTLSFRYVKPGYHYCPNCGARVVNGDATN